MQDSYTIEEQVIAAVDRSRTLRRMSPAWRLAVLMEEAGYNRTEVTAALAQAGITDRASQIIESAKRRLEIPPPLPATAAA
jgi:hypothetical protein